MLSLGESHVTSIPMKFLYKNGMAQFRVDKAKLNLSKANQEKAAVAILIHSGNSMLILTKFPD